MGSGNTMTGGGARRHQPSQDCNIHEDGNPKRTYRINTALLNPSR